MVDKEGGNKNKFKLRHGKPGRNKTTNTDKEMDQMTLQVFSISCFLTFQEFIWALVADI